MKMIHSKLESNISPLSLFQNVEHKTFETPQTPVSLSLSLASEEN